MKRAGIYIVAVLVAMGVLNQAAARPGQLSAEDVRKNWLGRLDGKHFSATVGLILDRQGKPREVNHGFASTEKLLKQLRLVG